jgi:hypothetical protein
VPCDINLIFREGRGDSCLQDITMIMDHLGVALLPCCDSPPTPLVQKKKKKNKKKKGEEARKEIEESENKEKQMNKSFATMLKRKRKRKKIPAASSTLPGLRNGTADQSLLSALGIPNFTCFPSTLIKINLILFRGWSGSENWRVRGRKRREGMETLDERSFALCLCQAGVYEAKSHYNGSLLYCFFPFFPPPFLSLSSPSISGQQTCIASNIKLAPFLLRVSMYIQKKKEEQKQKQKEEISFYLGYCFSESYNS